MPGMSDDAGAVTVERVDEGRVAIVTLHRPAKRNALGPAMWRGLADAATELRRQLPRAVIVTGSRESGVFCSGMDLSLDNPQVVGFIAATQRRDAAPARALLTELRDCMDALVQLPIPTIAAINGLAYGGGAELALRCDLRVIDAAARLSFSEVRLGVMPDMGGCVRLTRMVGPAIAADLILTARELEAPELLSLGLVSRISAPGESRAAALELARQIARNGPRAVRASLEVIRRTLDLDEADALALERERAARLVASGECVHGVTAFAERRTPSFPDIED